MKDNDILCEIKWTVADLRTAYVNHFGHNPTDEEVEELSKRLDVKTLEDISIERGWEIIESTL